MELYRRGAGTVVATVAMCALSPKSYSERRKVPKWKKGVRSEDDMWIRRISLDRKLPGGRGEKARRGLG